ncbi:hypothetical protein P5V15_006370 [Pogonomyrmex californicus]
MVSTNAFSDSQESELIDEETYKDIENTFGGTLPLPENISEFDVPEQKYAISQPGLSTIEEKISIGEKGLRRKLQMEEEEEYFLTQLYPPLNDYSNQLNFQYSFGDGGGQDWVYSQSLKKVFIKMEKTLPLRFSWEPSTSGLFLRTELAFVLEQYKSDPVKRCHNHIALTNPVNQNMNPDRIKHVVHCVNHASSMYQEENEHLSILTPLCKPEAGSQYVPMCFKFFCKNSCTSGMNRRPTELIFTLENNNGQILARRTLLVRVCSCPKRDKQKEETELEPIPVKRKLVLPPAKKMPSSSDMLVYKVELNIVGKENYLSVYKHAYDVMAGQAARTGMHEFFKPYMDDILHNMP